MRSMLLWSTAAISARYTVTGVGARLGRGSCPLIGAGFPRAAGHVALRRQITQADVPAHRHARDAVRELARERRKHCFRLRSAGRAIGDQSDAMSACGLTSRQIGDMAKQPADRCAHHMQNVERPDACVSHLRQPLSQSLPFTNH